MKINWCTAIRISWRAFKRGIRRGYRQARAESALRELDAILFSKERR